MNHRWFPVTSHQLRDNSYLSTKEVEDSLIYRTDKHETKYVIWRKYKGKVFPSYDQEWKEKCYVCF